MRALKEMAMYEDEAAAQYIMELMKLEETMAEATKAKESGCQRLQHLIGCILVNKNSYTIQTRALKIYMALGFALSVYNRKTFVSIV